jgi:hypothetical protein
MPNFKSSLFRRDIFSGRTMASIFFKRITRAQ